MGRRSSIDRWPPALREEIGRLIDAGRTLDEMLAALRAIGAPDVSRSSLHRHTQKLDRVGARLRQSRMMAETLVRQLGDQPGDQVARLNIELIHTLLHDLLTVGEDEGEEAAELAATMRNPKAVALVAEAAQRLTQASRTNAEFVAKLEARAADRAKREAAAAAEGVAREMGLTAETARLFKQRMLGLAAKAAP